jgi:hypothetical protein
MPAITTSKLVEYDGARRRLWILGQRCHHGAAGALVAAAALANLAVDAVSAPVFDLRSTLVMVATGGVLMAHDWKDLPIWFERGRGTQP